jgi:hypothetical protein
MKCEKCHYWRPLDAKTMPDPVPGHCHRHPPVQIFIEHEGPSARRDANVWTFPVVYSSSWCGEFKKMD